MRQLVPYAPLYLPAAIWLDSIRRSLVTGGDVQCFIDEDGLRSVTSNPVIFEHTPISRVTTR
jgi:hypothetical protein